MGKPKNNNTKTTQQDVKSTKKCSAKKLCSPVGWFEMIEECRLCKRKI